MDREKFVVHVDMDAFFASVEQKNNPGLKNRPVIVGADPKHGTGRGVVCAASYEARNYGIRSGMPVSTAYMRCPGGIFLRPDMQKYSKESKRIFSILLNFTPSVEPISVDEAFLDITGSFHFWGTPQETCLAIKKEIRKKTELTASLGMASNKTVAKIASDIKKPDGLVIVPEKHMLQFLHALPAEKLWGVGKKTLELLHEKKIYTVGNIANTPLNEMEKMLGKSGAHLWRLANGMDRREVITQEKIRSIGHEHTFSHDTDNTNALLNVLMKLSEKISRRLREKDLSAKTVTLKIRLSSFTTYTRSNTLRQPSSHVEEIYSAAKKKLNQFDLSGEKIRLLGIQTSNLVSSKNKSDLFEYVSEKHQKRERIHQAIDRLTEKYGANPVKRRSI